MFTNIAANPTHSNYDASSNASAGGYASSNPYSNTNNNTNNNNNSSNGNPMVFRGHPQTVGAAGSIQQTPFGSPYPNAQQQQQQQQQQQHAIYQQYNSPAGATTAAHGSFQPPSSALAGYGANPSVNATDSRGFGGLGGMGQAGGNANITGANNNTSYTGFPMAQQPQQQQQHGGMAKSLGFFASTPQQQQQQQQPPQQPQQAMTFPYTSNNNYGQPQQQPQHPQSINMMGSFPAATQIPQQQQQQYPRQQQQQQFGRGNNGNDRGNNNYNNNHGNNGMSVFHPQQQQHQHPHPQDLQQGGGGYGPMQHPQQHNQHPRRHHHNNNMHDRRGSRGGRGGGGAGGHQVHNSYFYNMQHHYNNNNAVPEKTPTLHLYCPPGKILSIKLNRIYSTMADLRSQLQFTTTGRDGQKKEEEDGKSTEEGAAADDKTKEAAGQKKTAGTGSGADEASAGKGDDKDGSGSSSSGGSNAAAKVPFDRTKTTLTVCLDFLSAHGCPHASGCSQVHIAGLQYTWEHIDAATESREVTKKRQYDDGHEETVTETEEMYKKGFKLSCYDPTLTKYYAIPSEQIIRTAGAESYVTMFNEHGDNYKAKFKLCPELISTGKCDAGAECPDIHCALSNFSALEEGHARRTHIKDAAAMSDEARLPAKMLVRVYEPNSTVLYKDYKGSFVLVTEGAKTYQAACVQANAAIPVRKRMQHCAHFRMKEMCRQGNACRFMHVLPTPEEEEAAAAAAAAAEGSDGQRESGSDADSSSRNNKKDE